MHLKLQLDPQAEISVRYSKQTCSFELTILDPRSDGSFVVSEMALHQVDSLMGALMIQSLKS